MGILITIAIIVFAKVLSEPPDKNSMFTNNSVTNMIRGIFNDLDKY